MSYLYTGTPALKTDFTRTGARTYKGSMNDAINSVTRYYINNFTDGYYHDCMDICAGKLSLDQIKNMKSRGFFSPMKITMFFIVLATCATKWAV